MDKRRDAPSEYGEGGPYDQHEGNGVIGWLLVMAIVVLAALAIIVAVNLNA